MSEVESVALNLSVPKEAYALGSGVVKFIQDIRKALADGWQPELDLPILLAAAVKDLGPAVQGIDQLGPELEANKVAFVGAFALAALEIFTAPQA